MRLICLGGVLGFMALSALPAVAAPSAQQEAREAAYLQEAFGSNLCARDDRELRKLNKALSKRPLSLSSAAGRAR